MKKFFSLMIGCMLAVGVWTAFAGCDMLGSGGQNTGGGGSGGGQIEDPSEKEGLQTVTEPEATFEYNEFLGYQVKIKGALKNTGKRKYSYVSISFTLYDAEGANIGQAVDNMNYLDVGEVWKYEANSLGFFEEKPASWKISEITYF